MNVDSSIGGRFVKKNNYLVLNEGRSKERMQQMVDCLYIGKRDGDVLETEFLVWGPNRHKCMGAGPVVSADDGILIVDLDWKDFECYLMIEGGVEMEVKDVYPESCVRDFCGARASLVGARFEKKSSKKSKRCGLERFGFEG